MQSTLHPSLPPGGKFLLLHKLRAKKRDLQIEVHAVQEELSCIESCVKKLMATSEDIVCRMRSQQVSFSECSARLTSLDDTITILRSMIEHSKLDSIVMEDSEPNTLSHKVKSNNFLEVKITNKAMEVERNGAALLAGVAALGVELGVLEEGKGVRELETAGPQLLVATFSRLSREVGEREARVTALWQAVLDWRQVVTESGSTTAFVL